MGRPLPLPDRARPRAAALARGGARTDANKVQGCASQVWLSTSIKPNGSGGPLLTFEGDSDAHIVRGLIAVLFALYSGKNAKDICRQTPWRCSKSSACASISRRSAQRLPLDGRADPPRRQRGAGRGALKDRQMGGGV